MPARNDQLEGGGRMIHVYTGKGKGKTTAALGLAVRAAGSGLKVYIGQFIKGRRYGELNALKKFKNIKIEQFGRRCFIKKAPDEEDIRLAREGFQKVKKIIAKRIFDVVILDEINVALHLKLISVKEMLSLIRNSPRKRELVLTGRYAPNEILKKADLVSDIREIRHYYRKGVIARRGIEF